MRQPDPLRGVRLQPAECSLYQAGVKSTGVNNAPLIKEILI
jgi:hypothetical protein